LTHFVLLKIVSVNSLDESFLPTSGITSSVASYYLIILSKFK